MLKTISSGKAETHITTVLTTTTTSARHQAVRKTSRTAATAHRLKSTSGWIKKSSSALVSALIIWLVCSSVGPADAGLRRTCCAVCCAARSVFVTDASFSPAAFVA